MYSDPDHNLIEDWVAVLSPEIEGEPDVQLTMGEHKTFDAVPRERCKAIRLQVRGRDEPIHAACVPGNGDRMHLYMRRAIKIGANGSGGRTINMPIIEITNAVSPGFVRLYVHPRHGVIVSTLNLEL